MRYNLERLRERLSAAWFAAIVAQGNVSGSYLTIDQADVLAIRERFDPPADRSVAKPRPREQIPVCAPRSMWPKWAVGVSYFANAEDRGVGDTIARHIGPFGGNLFKAWYLATFGQPCRCELRQEQWNSFFPFPKSTINQSEIEP